MATTNRAYILVAFILSAIAAVFNTVSLGTEYWVHGKTVWSGNETGNPDNTINYGLFQGNYRRTIPSLAIYQLSMTCNFGHNACAMLCGGNRYDMLNALYNNIMTVFDFENCPSTSTRLGFFQNKGMRVDNSKSVPRSGFINAGVWICTLIFVILAAVIGFFASVLALYNTVANPIYYLLSVESLWIYNGVAFCSTVLSMALWGGMYHKIIFHNVSIYDTLVGNTESDKMIYLGYSYWINFVPLAFYTASIGILFYRDYLNARDPKQQKVDLDVNASDPNLYLY